MLVSSVRGVIRRRALYSLAFGVLAAGLAMSTAVFVLVQGVLLRALPFPDQETLYTIWKSDPLKNRPVVELAYAELADLSSNSGALKSVALMATTVYGYGRIVQFGTHEPVQVETAPVSRDFFSVLGVKPFRGRDFSPGDDQPGAAPVVILSHRLWKDYFQSDPQAVGRQIRLSGVGCTVIGIMAADVDFPRGVSLWTPLGANVNPYNRRATFLQAVGRTPPSYTKAQLETEVHSVFQRAMREHPDVYSASQRAVVTPLLNYWLGSARLQLYASLAASLLLLISSVVTTTNLLLSNALTRRQEIAIRCALGATYRDLLWMFLAESLLCSALAGVLGVLGASVVLKVLIAIAPADIPRLSEVGFDAGTLTFTATASLIAGLVCSAAPTLVAARLNLEQGLRDASARLTTSKRSRLVQNGFATSQIAFTTLLLTVSILLVANVRAMQNADVGFDNRDAVTMNLALSGPEHDPVRQRIFYTDLLNRLKESPQVTHAGAVLVRPLEGPIGWDRPYMVEGEPISRPEDGHVANFEVITPNYLAAVGTPLLSGRDFEARDAVGSETVAIVSRSIADRIRRTLGRDPLGTRINVQNDWRRVVGITANTRYSGATTLTDDLYIPYLQSGRVPVNYIVVQGVAPAAELAALVRRLVAAIDATQVVARVQTIRELMDRNTARARFNMVILISFAVSALVLAAAGVYSVVRETTAARTREIAICSAIGAGNRQLIWRMAAPTVAFILLGQAIGFLLCFVLDRAEAAELYALVSLGPVIVGGVFCALLAISLIAAILPAAAASKVEPAVILRS